LNRARLRRQIIESLTEQGFSVENGRIRAAHQATKEDLRALHRQAVNHRVEKSRPAMIHREDSLLERIARGAEVIPQKIRPRLIEVRSKSEDERLFRYVGLHWSIPVSSGYGRRLRFLVVDEQNEKLIGIIGLGDPVFSLAARDNWVGWNKQQRRARLKHVMDAFILGAAPPYSLLLGGKLVAMLVASSEVSKAFKRKYHGRRALISGKRQDGRLVLVTTTSALGRSSVYNRIRYRGSLVYHRVGFTRGSGDFHFMNGLYEAIREHALQWCQATAKHERWGKGFRSRREVVKKCLSAVGLSTDLLYHRVEREVFAVPLARNTREFLQGKRCRVMWHHLSAQELSAWSLKRWMVPRAGRDSTYRDFEPEQYRLWDTGGPQRETR
jgi:hypothetical protein